MPSSKQQFSSAALDKLVDDSIAEADQLSEELKDVDISDITLSPSGDENFDDYISQSDKSWSEVASVIDKDTGESVSFGYVYKKICRLIDSGDAALQMLQSIDLDVADPQLISATSTLINALKGCMAEFTKIHQQWIRFNQTLKLEQIKLNNKKELIKYRHDVRNGTDTDQEKHAVTEMYEVKSADLVEFLQWQKEKREKENAKENKI